MRAEKGGLNYDEAANQLVLTLEDGLAELRSAKHPEAFSTESPESLFFGELTLALPLGDVFGKRGERRADLDEMTYAQLMEERARRLAAEEEGSGLSEGRLRVQVHLQKNFAMAFSVFSLAVFGVPLAIRVGRKETYANLGIALVIAMTYYFLMIVVSWMEKTPALRPDLLIWLPNIVFQAIGFYLMRRASRY